ncbi:hypothetical protein EOD39_13929 [Acipenser ruthenus]|uniref:Uncharacterized protein n=1 Tax=Acipenser ruthenus TaxID=7906 RepID=A0A444UHE8_ACIRT|nr:hypothetical protein EOD39_13929 [Acipenser ruthenus]
MGGIHSWLTSNLQRECCSLSPRSISLVLFALTTNGKCHRLKAVFATVVLSVAGSASLRPALGAHWFRVLALGSSLQPDRLGEQLEVSLVTWLTSPQSCRECGPGRHSGTLNTIILNSSSLSRKSAECRSLSIRASRFRLSICCLALVMQALGRSCSFSPTCRDVLHIPLLGCQDLPEQQEPTSKLLLVFLQASPHSTETSHAVPSACASPGLSTVTSHAVPSACASPGLSTVTSHTVPSSCLSPGSL